MGGYIYDERTGENLATILGTDVISNFTGETIATLEGYELFAPDGSSLGFLGPLGSNRGNSAPEPFRKAAKSDDDT
jgi:hypothetical protein